MLQEREKNILIELVCEEQTKMIVKDWKLYTSDKYRDLEEIKVKLKDGGTR